MKTQRKPKNIKKDNQSLPYIKLNNPAQQPHAFQVKQQRLTNIIQFDQSVHRTVDLLNLNVDLPNNNKKLDQATIKLTTMSDVPIISNFSDLLVPVASLNNLPIKIGSINKDIKRERIIKQITILLIAPQSKKLQSSRRKTKLFHPICHMESM